jgi:hypothetical protein
VTRRETSRWEGLGVKGVGVNGAGEREGVSRDGGEVGFVFSSCQPTFSEGYSSGPYSFRVLGPAFAFPSDGPSSFSYWSASRSSLGMPMYFDSRFERSSRVEGVPVEPSWLTSHHLLDGLPRESDPSGASLTLILGIGDNDGM